jgi:hypothetical protein
MLVLLSRYLVPLPLLDFQPLPPGFMTPAALRTLHPVPHEDRHEGCDHDKSDELYHPTLRYASAALDDALQHT